MLLIYTHKTTPRIRYIFKHIFTSILGIEIDFSENVEQFVSYSGPKFTYDKEELGGELFFEAHNLLFEKGIEEDVEIDLVFKDEIPYFFKSSFDSALSHDLFAASFYLITRYEEYLPTVKDSLGRFQAKYSLAYQNGFLKLPVVDLWAREILEKVQEKYPNVQASQRHFSFINTINVHEAFKYKNRGLVYTTLYLTRDILTGNFREVSNRLRVVFGQKKDPYDTFDFLIDMHRNKGLKSIFFFSIGENSDQDHNISLQREEYKELIKSIEDYAFVGLNYSFKSIENTQLKRLERKDFEEVCNRLPNRVRQHLFKINFPYTYREIVENDILKDFSMGYPEDIGFRASTCTPFLFYDLKYESLTLLKVFPFIFTDLALKKKYDHDRKKIKQEMMNLILTVKEFNGLFIGVFNNSTFSNETRWRGWRTIYSEFIDTVLSMK